MAVIHTKRNMVFVHGAEPGHDKFVVTMYAPGDGSNLYKNLCVQPIDRWQAAVDWAVGIADQMAGPLRVGAIGMDSFLRMYGDQCERALAAMSSGEQAELRQQMITTCAEALRDCPDTDTRADAYDVLVKLGVFPC